MFDKFSTNAQYNMYVLGGKDDMHGKERLSWFFNL